MRLLKKIILVLNKEALLTGISYVRSNIEYFKKEYNLDLTDDKIIDMNIYEYLLSNGLTGLHCDKVDRRFNSEEMFYMFIFQIVQDMIANDVLAYISFHTNDISTELTIEHTSNYVYAHLEFFKDKHVIQESR